MEYLLLFGSGCFFEMSIFGEYLCIIGNLKGFVYVMLFLFILNVCKNVIVVYYINSFDFFDVFVVRDE